MKRILQSTISTALLLAATAAFAASATGSIKSVDLKTHAVTLSDGQRFMFPAHMDLSKLRVGEKVTITYGTKAGKHEASKIVAAS
ncbi:MULTISPECIES: DUF1344 domain-containing protein [unclassified Sinorhizobium]|uniref:DUF1344 domain-containing protein n=1 Tax=unclassified Sinorhizobium TaxID=2613772 RepID=UPI0035255084